MSAAGHDFLAFDSRNMVNAFHRLNYESGVWSGQTRWLGKTAQKCPFDLWVYQEILCELSPDIVIETGTADGGTALFLAVVMDAMKFGQVVTIDIKDCGAPEHPRMIKLIGDSVDEQVIATVRGIVDGKKAMVILDSDHSKDHVLREMELYSQFVDIHSYLIVEDTNLNGNPVRADFGPGPAEAVEEFLEMRDDFTPDYSREKFFLTYNPGGYLKRVR